MAYTDKKVLIAEMKDDDGQKVIYPLDRLDLEDVMTQVRDDLEVGESVTVRFYYRGKKWVDKQPEYQG